MHNKVEGILSYKTIGFTLNEYGVNNWNIPMTMESFKIYKGTTNKVVLIVRNNDRKPINLAGRNLIVTISDYDTYETLLSRRVEIINKYQGQALLVLEPQVIDNWPLGMLRYTLALEEPDGTTQILWQDQNMNAEGNFQLLDGPTLGPKPSEICDNFTPNQWIDPIYPHVDNFEHRSLWWYTGAFKGNAFYSNYQGIQTGAIYCNNFSGWVAIQGSLEEIAPVNDKQWFIINSFGLRNFLNKDNVYSLVPQNTYELPYTNDEAFKKMKPNPEDSPFLRFNNFTGVSSISFEGKIRWVRFAFIADKMNIGSLDKIMFRG